MRILICGPRDRDVSDAAIDKALRFMGISPPSVVIHGGATGIDSAADRWAKSLGIETDPYPVSDEEWARLGKSAGPRRNYRMLAQGEPYWVVAFRDRPTKGTSNMLKQAHERGVPAAVFDLEGN